MLVLQNVFFSQNVIQTFNLHEIKRNSQSVCFQGKIFQKVLTENVNICTFFIFDYTFAKCWLYVKYTNLAPHPFRNREHRLLRLSASRSLLNNVKIFTINQMYLSRQNAAFGIKSVNPLLDKGGPEATFCVRIAWNHHKLMGGVL